MSELRFTVLGKAAPGGSKRAFAIRKGGVPTGQVAVVDANRRAKPWQAEVRAAAADAMYTADAGFLLTGPLNVSMTFYQSRPKSHYGTGRNSSTLKPSARPFPTSAPDALKLARGTEDALTGVVFVDDAQVVDLDVHKRYGVPERCEVVIYFTPLPTREAA